MRASVGEVAGRLHRYLAGRVVDGALVGPDPGVRFNARFGRFIKSYVPMPWHDDLTYMQTQAYWVFSNGLLFEMSGDSQYLKHVEGAANYIVSAQNQEGAWEYPNPEWSGRVATVEGCMAGLALIEAHRLLDRSTFLEAAIRWYRFMVSGVGFSEADWPELAAINYFAGWDRAVPNNNTLALWFIASLADRTEQSDYLEYASRLLGWVDKVQLPSGELPYLIGTKGAPDRVHFLCYQYNAFEFVDLCHYLRLTGDSNTLRILHPLAAYLETGVTSSGQCMYACGRSRPHVLYYTSALGHALRTAADMGIRAPAELADRCTRTVVELQRPKGSFEYHSAGSYGFLVDRRSYPRYLSMVLFHLLSEEARDS